MITWPTGSCRSTAQHRERVPSGVWLAQEKMKFKNLKYRFLLKAYCFHTITKSKNRKLNHHKSGTVCIYQEICNEELAHAVMEAEFQDLLLASWRHRRPEVVLVRRQENTSDAARGLQARFPFYSWESQPFFSSWGPSWLDESSHLQRAMCFISSTDSNVSFVQKHLTDTPRIICDSQDDWANNMWPSQDDIKISHHNSLFTIQIG